MSPLLTIDRLALRLPVNGVARTILHEVCLSVAAGEAVGLVGESGSGKSMTARAVARLLPSGAQVTGRIAFDGHDVLGLRGGGLRRYRTDGVAVIFQDPRAHINPVRTVGDFLTETMRSNDKLRPSMARSRAVELLASVGIDDGVNRLRQYPHQLSGGLLQRVMIAAVLAGDPKLILADEPTTALDVTTQSDVMALLDRLRRERSLAMLFITHDLELAAAVCDRTAVMYAGSIVEQQPSAALHVRPLHPYTAALLSARPDIARTVPRLRAVPGQPQSAFEAPPGCPFAPRCGYVQDRCRANFPALEPVGPGHTRCLRSVEIAADLAVQAASAVPEVKS